MTEAQQREAARQFFYKWNNKGKEDEHSHLYWLEMLQDVLGVEDVMQRVNFEKKVIGSKGTVERIDVYIPETRVIIEQKSQGVALDKPQPGHDMKTPYEQAKGYDNYLPYEERARWIVLSNFQEIWIYDLNMRKPEPVKLNITDLQDKFHMLDFLTNKKTKKVTEEIELSKAAGELVGKIRDRFLTQYNDPLAKRTQKSLNILCVRLVFCFYAEDAGLFGAKDAFCTYLMQYQPKDMRGALIELFKVLDTPLNERADMYLSDELEAFPYVNGGLFSDENIVIPKITKEIKDTLIESSRFDWSKISPTIFGAVFESTLNPVTRRKGGMHYTSIENIHKVIDPLFLDELKEELEEIRNISVLNTQKKRLGEFQKKMSEMIFFDPACGSGNFLTETYVSLRRLENEALRLKVAADRKLMDGQISFGFDEESPIQVSIHQFYGIEINDFAVAVAQTALWIAESQMMKETEDIVHSSMDFFPLKTYRGITEGNALQIEWAKVVPIDRLSYIIGNPPFVGARIMSSEQKNDLMRIFDGVKGAGNLDYVCCWYALAAKLIYNTKIRAAFVSTNSVTQGEQVAILWKPLMTEYRINIIFGHRTFVWDSEANVKAHVHCVIIGFCSGPFNSEKYIFTEETKQRAENINGYLIDAENVFIENCPKPICADAPSARSGNKPIDDGNYLFTREEMEAFIEKEPASAKYFRPWIGSYEFINKKERFCLWLGDCTPSELKKMPECMKRVQAVFDFRSASRSAGTRNLAQTPTRFHVETLLDSPFLVMPLTSSERRRYVPIGYMPPVCLASNLVVVVANATMYHFGVLTSNVFMSWMRAVCGRLKSDYRITKDNVYNNFPWPDPTPKQKELIEKTAQGILNARAKYPDSSLADLYDPLTMPPELRRAHTANDVAVMQAYGMPIKETDEAACVAWLMRLYQEKINEISS